MAGARTAMPALLVILAALGGPFSARGFASAMIRPTFSASAIERAGGALLMRPFDVGDAGRMAGFTDPTGATCFAWEAKGTEGAELVNAHGSWNFSELNTGDRTAALAFYGEVFGWEMSDRASEDPGMSFWRRPGYGDFLEALTPGTRERTGCALGANDDPQRSRRRGIHGESIRPARAVVLATRPGGMIKR